MDEGRRGGRTQVILPRIRTIVLCWLVGTANVICPWIVDEGIDLTRVSCGAELLVVIGGGRAFLSLELEVQDARREIKVLSHERNPHLYLSNSILPEVATILSFYRKRVPRKSSNNWFCNQG
jgi:hypothetical protein